MTVFKHLANQIKLSTCGGPIMPPCPPKMAEDVISRIYEYTTLHGKRNFLYVINDAEVGRLSWII